MSSMTTIDQVSGVAIQDRAGAFVTVVRGTTMGRQFGSYGEAQQVGLLLAQAIRATGKPSNLYVRRDTAKAFFSQVATLQGVPTGTPAPAQAVPYDDSTGRASASVMPSGKVGLVVAGVVLLGLVAWSVAK